MIQMKDSKRFNPANIQVFFALLSLALAFFTIVIHLKFFLLPVFFLMLGFFSYRIHSDKSLYFFFFLLPLLGCTPLLFFNGYPPNYMGIPLFYLSGIFLASLSRKEKPEFDVHGLKWYLLFLTILWLSALFVFLRWSNITLSPLAIFVDTPVAPSGDRFSFASIFPVITLFIFSAVPLVLALIRQNRLSEQKIFKSILLGYSLSFITGLIQNFIDPGFLAQGWWLKRMGQVTAGFSDPNAFGFFSGILLLYVTVRLIPRSHSDRFTSGRDGMKLPVLILAAGCILEGVFISGSRIALLCSVIAVIFILLNKVIRFRWKAAAVVLWVVLFMLSGGVVKKRVTSGFGRFFLDSDRIHFIDRLDRLSNLRITMLRYSIPMIKQVPISGVGTGNFLFSLKNLKYGESFVEDLPLNQYLLILDETGFVGLTAFVLFLFGLMRGKKSADFFLILATVLIFIFFQNAFWFPEIYLIFWILIAFLREPAGKARVLPEKPGVLAAILIGFFILGNLFSLDSLHPKNWNHEKNVPYDYGFWYWEKEGDRNFRWSSGKAGFYRMLNEQGNTGEIRLYCGAPLHRLRNHRQRVNIYWKGKLFKTVTFRKNREFGFSIAGRPGERGLVELRVVPTFNLRKLGVSDETRTLGVQVY